MKSYTVTTSGMGQHITAKNYNESFTNRTKAIIAFEAQCDRLEYDNVSVDKDGGRDAGGIGYDYRITLSIDNSKN